MEEQNLNEALHQALRKTDVSGSSLDYDLVEQRCQSVLKYLFPNCETQMSAKQYNNAMDALRSIAFGVPVKKNYR